MIDKTQNTNQPLDPSQVISLVTESLNNLMRYELNIDSQSITLCIAMLQEYADRLECQKGVPPVIPSEIETVMYMLNKVSKDLDNIRDVIRDDLKVLDQSLA